MFKATYIFCDEYFDLCDEDCLVFSDVVSKIRVKEHMIIKSLHTPYSTLTISEFTKITEVNLSLFVYRLFH